MSTHDLTLISHPLCPFVQRSAIVLLEKNVPFERVNVDLSASAPSYSGCQTVSVPHPSGLKTPQPVATIRL
ncbi:MULTISPECIES: glutathione S-transferase N-terminal domain-containing protein [Yersinia]|jgi:Glutathione S-transferase, N-terminal domain|uniref:glutathione S-transferase N-terminal domain-containing protein n=1 Tax=Yersinia TaxID=629 RepID=UPI0005AD271F|nr:MULTISPECIES: glutathione S-transferase N-terminal domain-containing protein [Yersinia]AJJ18964.1 hypothetical protein CH53_3021 [Yersinia intermedia]CNE26411.1 Uncharacterised protein [Yersinia intermedia]CNH93411.1 Uncharacterised protein [Yersinia intermedia]CNI71522.1 Uncharacterised protein [Yersinia intermedia]